MAAVREALARAPGLDPAEVEDIVLGCAMPEGGQGLNVARQVALGAGLPVSAAAMTVNRFCASGLQSLALAHQAVVTGVTDVVVAGGLESMSAVPMIGWHYAPNPGLAERWPEVYLGMGLTGEEVARREGVDREAQDAWGLRSHQRAAAAQDAGPLPRRDRARSRWSARWSRTGAPTWRSSASTPTRASAATPTRPAWPGCAPRSTAAAP